LVEEQLGRGPTACRTAREPLLAPDGAAFGGVVPCEVSQAAVAHFCRREWAQHLDDVMIRRTSWRYYHGDHLAVAERVAEWMAFALGWPAERTEREVARYRQMTRPLAAEWLPVPTGDPLSS
jgi:glycerol-3-phosphate dehydrogenase